MFKLLLTGFLLLPLATYSQSMSPEEAGKLANTLSDSNTDSVQIAILLKLAKYHVFKPGENKNDLDSAVNLIKMAEGVNSPIKSKWANGYILLIKSYLLRESGQTESAKESVRQATVILKDAGDKLLAGEAYFDYSGYFQIYETEPLDHRITLVDTAVSFFQQSGNQERLGASLYMLGDLHYINGTDFIALQKLRLALEVYATIRHDAVQGLYSLMGRIYTRQRDYKNALNYELQALKAAEKVGDSSIQMCMVNNDLARTFSELNEKDKALSYFNNALQIAERHKDNKAIYVTNTEIAKVWNSDNNPKMAIETLNRLLIKYERPKDIGVDFNIASTYITSYSMSKQYSRAEPYVSQILNMAKTLKLNDYANIMIYAEAIKFYIVSGQFKLATDYLKEHKKLAGKQSELLHMGNNHRLWFMLDTARHDYRSAINHLLAYKRLDDSLFNQTKSHQISELEIQYETEKKEKNLLVKDQNIQLLTEQSQLQQSKIKNDRLVRNAIIMGAGLLLFVLLLLYNRYRLKQKSNRQLQEQQQQINHQNLSLQGLVREQNKLIEEKEWLVKEIHHRVKNNFQTVMGLLGTQSGYLKNEAAINAIKDSQHRIQAMSLIHQRLYQTENLSAINMPDYVHELVDSLNDSFNTSNQIRFSLEIEPIDLDLAHCIPLGLILNEAITNSFKYAFPDNAEGTISISLKHDTLNHIVLSVKDDGTGLPPSFNIDKSGSMGMNLMQGLSEEIGAQFKIDSQNGTHVSVGFVFDPEITNQTLLVTTKQVQAT